MLRALHASFLLDDGYNCPPGNSLMPRLVLKVLLPRMDLVSKNLTQETAHLRYR